MHPQYSGLSESYDSLPPVVRTAWYVFNAGDSYCRILTTYIRPTDERDIRDTERRKAKELLGEPDHLTEGYLSDEVDSSQVFA